MLCAGMWKLPLWPVSTTMQTSADCLPVSYQCLTFCMAHAVRRYSFGQTLRVWSNFLVLLKFELCRPSLDSFYRSNKIVIYPKISFYYSLNFLTVAFSYHTSRCVTIICFFLCSVFKIQCHSLSEMVGQNGLEPSTSRLSVVCSSQLSYWPIWWRLAGSNR